METNWNNDKLATPLQSNTAELAATYAALILADEGVEITVRIRIRMQFPIVLTAHPIPRSQQADKIVAITSSASVEVEPIWASLLAKALEGKDVKSMLTNIGAGGGAPAAAAPGATAGGAAAAGGDAPAAEEKK